MKLFYIKFIKPMLWFWIAIVLSAITLTSMNVNGYRLFSNNTNSFTNNGPGYHK